MKMKFRTTKVIEAEQFDGSDEMIEKYGILEAMSGTGLYMRMPFGQTRIKAGDWIELGSFGTVVDVVDDMDFRLNHTPVSKVWPDGSKVF